MKLAEAESILREIEGRSYEYMIFWGLSNIREAVRTVKSRKSASAEIKDLAEKVSYKIFMGFITPKHWRGKSY